MEVIALVGASGTGKSQRALAVAQELNTEYIIDDGLFIRGSSIVAGKSAKAEKTTIAAVRRALFNDPEHAAAVRGAIARHKPHRILLLATSDAMVDRIVQALRLPEPTSRLRIEDVVPEEEIKAAIKARKRFGRHVIPVPSFEVKKTFRGYLINSLRLLYQGARLRRPVVFEKSVVRPTFGSLGRFFISDRVLADIAGRAAAQRQDVEVIEPVVARSSDGVVYISLNCAAQNGDDLTGRLCGLQEDIKETVEELTSIPVQAVDIHVLDVRDLQQK